MTSKSRIFRVNQFLSRRDRYCPHSSLSSKSVLSFSSASSAKPFLGISLNGTLFCGFFFFNFSIFVHITKPVTCHPITKRTNDTVAYLKQKTKISEIHKTPDKLTQGLFEIVSSEFAVLKPIQLKHPFLACFSLLSVLHCNQIQFICKLFTDFSFSFQE